MIKKLTSRKFWAMLISAIAGLAIAFGADGEIVQIVAGIASTLASCAIYIYVEGKIDAAAVKQLADGVNNLIDKVEGNKDGNTENAAT